MIHKYKLNQYNIVLDVDSGAVHVMDDLSYDMVDWISPDAGGTCPSAIIEAFGPPYSRDQIEEAYGELFHLIQDGQLFSTIDYRDVSDKIGMAPIKAMCLNIAHDCNLRCEYCFAAQGDFGQGRKLMSAEMGKKAVDFLLEHSEGRRNLEVDFFGGEPLMNFQAVRDIVAYARSLEKERDKNFRFTLTTNGLLLNDQSIDFINREMSNVVLSIDGRKEINDRLRVTSAGQGSYDVIVDKYKKLAADHPSDYYVRGTFTKYNLDFTDDVLHLYDSGFDQISVEPVVTQENVPFALTEDDLPRIYDEYDRLAQTVVEMKRAGKSIHFFHFMLDLDGGPCAIKRLRGCSSGNEYVAVTPDGDIYPCHQFVGMEEWKMGNLADGTFDGEKKRYFAGCNIFRKKECQACWAKFFCSGGCNANNVQFSGDTDIPHPLSCALEKKRLECAIMIQAAQHNDCPACETKI